jgi:hypothetical protein
MLHAIYYTTEGIRVAAALTPAKPAPSQFARRNNNMQTENLNEIAAALAKAQGTMEAAKFNKIVNFSGRSYKYADLAAIIDAIRKPLSDNGIGWTQTIEIRDGGLILATMLLHTSGQALRSEYPLPSSGKPQEMGSATTYAKRYSLAAIVGIAADDDDDADAAEKGGLTVAAPKKKYTDNYDANTKADLDRAPVNRVEPPVHPVTGETGPHAIVEPDDMKWGAKFVAAIKAAKTDDEIKQWMDVNCTRLDNVAIDAPKIHDRIVTNIEVASEALKRNAA